ncbi:MAG: hypothetical protein IMZ61_06475 [Planctomycetes bacterium]|nr:hypothetical protein [Planctomycetota bacterium]
MKQIERQAGFGVSLMTMTTTLEIDHFDVNGKLKSHDVVRNRCITDGFVQHIVDVLQGTAGPVTNIQLFKWHISGVGAGAESTSDTGIYTSCTGDSGQVGTQVEGTGANIYKSVGTITYTATHTIIEHVLACSSNTGTIMDRTLFTGKAVVSGESIQFTYTVEFTSGG